MIYTVLYEERSRLSSRNVSGLELLTEDFRFHGFPSTCLSVLVKMDGSDYPKNHFINVAICSHIHTHSFFNVLDTVSTSGLSRQAHSVFNFSGASLSRLPVERFAAWQSSHGEPI